MNNRGVGLNQVAVANLVPPLLIAAVAWYVCGDYLAGLGVLVIGAAWRLLPSQGVPPVLALAFTFQWLQVTLGVYYYGVTQRPLETVEFSDYRPMVLLGLGWLTSLLVGLTVGSRLLIRKTERPRSAPAALSLRTLFMAYLMTTAANGLVRQLAWLIPGLTQGILAVSFLRLGLLFLILRRLCRPVFRAEWFAGLLAAEVVMGFIGFFASFREPLMVATLALLEIFDRTRKRHWIVAVGVVLVISLVGVLWMGIRTAYRKDLEIEEVASSQSARLNRVGALSSEWFSQDLNGFLAGLDFFVERVWAVYYPALALQRVPAVLPHEEGALLATALRHVVTPRLFFPEKAGLISESQLVRKYSGMWVAGEEEGTSIAFGYAAESYVDFGLPWMFLPVLVYGVLMGMAYSTLLKAMRNQELAVALVTVVFWLSLFLFERSWAKTLGLAVTLIIFLGGAVLLLDRMLSRHHALRAPLTPRRNLMMTRR